jgi:hypothetical protein
MMQPFLMRSPGHLNGELAGQKIITIRILEQELFVNIYESGKVFRK